MIACKDKSEKESSVEATTGDSIQTVDRKTDSLLKIKNIQDSIHLVKRKDSILLKTTQNILGTTCIELSIHHEQSLLNKIFYFFL